VYCPEATDLKPVMYSSPSIFIFSVCKINALYVTVVTQGGGIGGGPIIAEDQARKREMRLLKNR
jgi:hypothetical protein